MPDPTTSPVAEIAARAHLRRVHMLAWRDLDDPEAGGSELHAHEIAKRWAAGGLSVTMRASRAPDQPTYAERDGYHVVRKSGRYGVFPRSAVSGLLRRDGQYDGLVEIWNGMPFLSPVWAHVPRVVFLHHVHAEMWRMVLKPELLGRMGEAMEHRVAPPIYRRSRIVTLSASSKDEIVEMLRLPAGNIEVVAPGIDARFHPSEGDHARSARPLVVAVGRLVPVKRFDLLIESLVALQRSHPDLRAVIVGEGYERPALEALVRQHKAESWLTLPGRVSDERLVELYQQAWAVASSSAREGWGMTLTEAAACGTPAVVTRIAGHADSVADGVSGLLADQPSDLTPLLDKVLSDPHFRSALRRGAIDHAARFSWDATAIGALEVLADEAERRSRRRSARPARQR